VVDGVFDDVADRLAVVLFRLDHSRPESLAEDVMLAAVAFVERPRILAVEVAHAVREVCDGGLDEQVVVVPEQAADVETPAIPAFDVLEDLDEDPAVVVVAEDRLVVVALRRDVVAGAGGKCA